MLNTIRDKLVRRNSIVSLCARLIQIAASFTVVPIVVHGLGSELFAIWALMIGLVALLPFVDIGVGVGLQAELSKLDIDTERAKVAKNIVAAAFLLLVVVVIVVLGIEYRFFSAYISGLSVSKDAMLELESSSTYFTAAVAIAILGSLFQRHFEAFQRAYISNGLMAIGRVLSVFITYVILYAGVENPLGILVFSYITMPYILLSTYFFVFECSKCFHTVRFPTSFYCELKSILRIGASSLGAQFSVFFISSGFMLLLARYYSMHDMAALILIHKVVMAVSLLFGAYIMPFWPAIVRASKDGDYAWVLTSEKKVFAFATLYSLSVAFVMLGAGPQLLSAWSGLDSSAFTFSMILVSAMWIISVVFFRSVCTLLNASENFKIQGALGIVFPLLACTVLLLFNHKMSAIFSFFVILLLCETLRTILLMIYYYAHARQTFFKNQILR